MTKNIIHHYSEKEERLNVLTHGFGLVLSLVAFPFLVMKSQEFTGFWQQASFIIYGLSLIILYAASTFYHAAKNPKRRRKLNIFDHAAIYVLIAGSYTPFLLAGLQSNVGWYMFIFVWIFALIGVILKLFFTGKFDKLSTAMYLVMGWQAIFVVKPMMASLPKVSLYGIVLGGVFYTVGAIFYSIEKIKFNHAIFHVFVLLGSLAHFAAVYIL